jgi:hypothetical protein
MFTQLAAIAHGRTTRFVVASLALLRHTVVLVEIPHPELLDPAAAEHGPEWVS